MEYINLIDLYLSQHFATDVAGLKHNTSPYLDLTIVRELAYVFHLTVEEAMDSFCAWCEDSGNDYQIIISNK
jgi:hypothetical protein